MPVLDQRKVWVLLSEGVHEVARVVEKTYGPAGGKVMVAKNGSVLVTTDGAALTRESQLGGKRRLGATLVRTAALKTEAEVGDGTSTTVLLTSALLREIGKLAVAPDWDPVRVVQEIRSAAEIADASISKLSAPPDEESLSRIAHMASHEDPLVAEKVVEAVLGVGEQGSVVIAAHEGTGIVLEQKEGLLLRSGWVSYAMAPEGANEREMDGPLVAVFRRPLRKSEDVAAAMEAATQWPGRGLLIFAPSVSGEALATILVNDKKGVLSCVAVDYSGSPGDLLDWLEDLTTVTNSTLVDPDAGRPADQFKGSWLGYARRATISKDRTLLVSYMDEEILSAIDRRVSSLRARAESSEYPFERDQLTERASTLDGGLATLRVGGLTKQEAQDRRSRVEDALRAAETALRGGIVPGAGRTYFAASFDLPETVGASILRSGLRSIFGSLAKRAGEEAPVLIGQAEARLSKDTTGWLGYDLVKKNWRDLRKAPKIVDPTEVVRSSVRNAVSVACQIALCGGVLIAKVRR